MKKLITLLVCLSLGIGISCARDCVSRNVNDLPQKARTTLSSHFKASVSHIKIDSKMFGGKEYDVILNDGTEVEFDADGNWREIDCGTKAVPSKLILPAIAKYVKQNYPSGTIVKIEVDSRHYEVELNNGIDLKFSRDGKFVKVD